MRTAPGSMKSVVLACLALGAPLAMAGDASQLSSVNVSFGRGLNTAQPGNSVNHVILPSRINVKKGGVVDFGVAGFHDIIIFEPGVTLQDLLDAGGGTYPEYPVFPFVFEPDPTKPFDAPSLADRVYYRGLNPAGGPPQTPVTANPSNTLNRSEPVAFLEAGTYLVICNIRPHLLDGMYAYVHVTN
jgi:plastocyanin